MTTDVTVRGALTLAGDQQWWNDQQLAALEQLGIQDAPRGDQAVFLHVAQRTGLDPFARQIYMIGRWSTKEGRNKYTIQTSIDGFRLIAQRSGEYAGQVGPQWCGDDEVWHEVWPKGVQPLAARIGVYRKGFVAPVWGVAHFHEYADDRSPMWKAKPALMLAKCAEALGLRKAFPLDLSGLYTDDEMTQAGPADVEPPVTVDDLLAKVEAATDTDTLNLLWHEAGQRGLLDSPGAEGVSVRDAILAHPAAVPARDAAQEVMDAVEGAVIEHQGEVVDPWAEVQDSEDVTP